VLGLAHVPGTGTPQASGLYSGKLLDTLRSLALLNLVGADIVEVAPSYALGHGHRRRPRRLRAAVRLRGPEGRLAVSARARPASW